MESSFYYTFRDFVLSAVKKYDLRYLTVSTFIRKRLERHRLRRSDVVIHINYATGRFTQDALAKIMGVSQATISNRLRKLNEVWPTFMETFPIPDLQRMENFDNIDESRIKRQF